MLTLFEKKSHSDWQPQVSKMNEQQQINDDNFTPFCISSTYKILHVFSFSELKKCLNLSTKMIIGD